MERPTQCPLRTAGCPPACDTPSTGTVTHTAPVYVCVHARVCLRESCACVMCARRAYETVACLSHACVRVPVAVVACGEDPLRDELEQQGGGRAPLLRRLLEDVVERRRDKHHRRAQLAHTLRRLLQRTNHRSD